jgi:ketosteroid isomerase-like protein
VGDGGTRPADARTDPTEVPVSQTDIAIDAQRLARVIDQQEIRDVCYRYCRGIDRRDYDLVRSCYHPDAVDQHGEYVGGVDGFIEHVQQNIARFDRTMHFLGNILVEVDGDRARGEAYAMAYHHLPAGKKPERYFIAALRYVDDFERRDGEWRIATRVCVFEWTRMEPAGETPYQFTEHHHMGRTNGDDLVFAPTLKGL